VNAVAARSPSRIATLVSLAALAVAAVSIAWSLPIDDFWLAIASGRAILSGADAAHAIALSWMPTIPGALNPQWGAQVMFAAVDNLGWALAVNAALIAIGLGLTLVRMARRGGPAAVAIASFLGLAVLSVHLLARPQSFSIALFPMALVLLERFRDRWWLPFSLGVLVAGWANLHGAFVVGQLAAAATLADVAWLAWRRRDPAARRTLLICALALVAAGVAPLMNPAGGALLGYAYGQGVSDVVRAISVEWQPAWPWEPIGTLFWGLVVLLVVGRILRRGGAGLGELLLGLTLGILAATGVRFIPWFVIAMAPLLAADVEALLEHAPLVRRAVGDVPSVLLGASGARLLAVLAVACVVLQPIRPALHASLSRLTPDEPVAAAERLQALVPGSRTPLLNEQVWGGYLSWSLGDRIQTAMDGRIEIRSRDTWQRYFDLIGGTGDAAEGLAAAGVRWALLLPGRTALTARLEASGWKETYQDEHAIVLHRP